MIAEYVIFDGPYAVAGMLAIVALIVWRRNLGPTLLFWVLLILSAVLVGVAWLLRIGIWLGDI